MMRAKKSSKRLVTMLGIALLVALLGAFPGYTAGEPEVSDLDQTIAEGGNFTITLDDYVTDNNTPDADIVWTYTGNSELTVTIDVNRVATIGTPHADWNGSETITFTAKDLDGKTGSDAASFTVTAVNDAPAFTKGANQTVSEDAGAQTVNGWATGISAGPANESGQSLAFQVGNDNNGLFAVQPAINATTGDLTYTPADDANGSATVTVILQDNGGTANGGQDTSAPQSFTITCNAVNDTPVVSDIPDQTIAEGGSFTTISLDDYVTDVDNADAEMTWSYSGNSELTVTIDGNRVATLGIPSADWYGFEAITFRATDPDGPFDEDSATFTVTAVNDPPVANDDSDTTPEDTPVSTNVVANDTDVDGTVVSSAVAIVSGPSNGSVVNNGNGTVTYTPNANFNGSDTYTYTVQDSDGATSNVATVTINVGVVNDAPVANDDSTTTPEDTPVTTNVVANDTDVDGTVVASTVAIVNGPSNGSTLNNGNGTVTYTPNENFYGSDSFTYTVKDNGGATSNVAAVTINVGVVNDPPVAQMDSEITDESVPVTIPVLANDSDPDGDRLTVESVTQPPNGTVTNNGTDVTYSPDPDSNGMGTFTYTVADGNGGTDTTTVMVAVAIVNDPPVAQEDSAITDENMPLTIPVLANDSDPDGDRLTVEAVTQPSNGTVTNNGTDVTYSPDPDFNGSDSFTYTVSDKNGSTDTARVSVEVLEGAADGEGGAYGPSEGKVKLGELVSQVRFVKRDTDNISWLVPGVPNLTVLEDSMVLEKLALSTDLQPTRYRAGAHLEVGVELPTMEERRAHGWPWIRVTSPDLAEPGNVTAGFSFSGRSADGIYWFGIDIGDVPWGRYDFWIVYGEEKMILVPIIVLP